MNISTAVRPSYTSPLRGTGAQRMLIDGRRLDAVSAETIEIFDPNTGQPIGNSPAAGTADIELAVAAAARSFERETWRGLLPSARAKILWRAADIMETRSQELADLECLNSGMLLPLALGMIGGAIETLRYYAGFATKIYGVTTDMSSQSAQFHAFTLREPVGVCAMVVAWNAPVVLTMAKLAPALAAGCSCIVKPSEETPFTALLLAEILQEAGVPDGVVNVVTGYGHVAGAALAAHDKVAKIAFTGSTEVGKSIVRAASHNLKKVTLELGGKSPIVIFDDANLAKAIPAAAMGIFLHSGQLCVAGSRLYVQRKSFDQVVSGVANIAAQMKIGNSFDPATQIGPLISAKQLDRVTGLIESGLAQGAELVSGGQRVAGAGYFVEPTVLINPDRDARILKEEIFGPVLSVVPFDELDDVAAMANDTEYGLASGIWTEDINKAHLLAKKLQAGSVWINCTIAYDASLPSGGYKQSGWGREMGPDGLDPYLQTKAVYAALS